MNRGRRGLLVALEGIDGAGKSTLAMALAAALRARGFRVRRRREPADASLGRLAQSAAARDPWTGAIYFTLDRFLARDALEEDLRHADFVVSDRSLYSTLAYQGSALPAARVRELESLGRRATILPDRVVLLELAPSEAIRRLGARAARRGPLERRRTLTRVAARYRRLARSSGWTVLDARRPTEELVEAIVPALVPSGRAGRKRSRTFGAQRT
jgi:dTMP kinase